MTFGKIGRPPEDRFARRLEIFEAVAPLILTVGARRLSMEAAASAAGLSVGGVYHYFPTKRSLVLYTLEPHVLDRRCTEFHEQNSDLAIRDPERYLDLYVDFAVQGVRLWQPAIHAALELGVETFWSVIERAMNLSLERFRNMKRTVSPGTSDEALDQLEEALRRACLAACLDKRITPEALCKDIHAMFRGYMVEAAGV